MSIRVTGCPWSQLIVKEGTLSVNIEGGNVFFTANAECENVPTVQLI